MALERNLLKAIKEHEYLDASQKAFESAEWHKKTAESIAKDGHFGIPVSHLILSTEQSVAGLLIYAQHIGFDIKNTPRIHLFFTDHIIKHNLATLISVMYPILTYMIGYVEKSRDKLHNKIEIEESISFSTKKEVVTLFKDLPEMFEWWENANIQKNKGFYIDYSSSLETPMQVTQTEYELAFYIIENFQNQVSELVRFCENLSEEEKKELIKNFKINEMLVQLIEVRREHMKKNKGIKPPENTSTKNVKENNDSPSQ